MKITEVRITLRDDGKLRAFASITLENCFVIRGLKVIEGNSGLFVAMPSRRRPDGTYQDIAHPINTETRDMLEREVLQVYNRELENEKAGVVSAKSLDDI
jgi:stage V sporulation protein G